MSKYYFTYVLKSIRDSNLYIGYTNNINRRFKEHNLGKVFATKCKRPWELVYFEGCLNKNKAIEREKSLKTGFGRKYLKNRLK